MTEEVKPEVKADSLDKVSENITSRARAVISEGHSTSAILKNAFEDVKRLQKDMGMIGIMQFVTTGKLAPEHVAMLERIAVKALAALSKIK